MMVGIYKSITTIKNTLFPRICAKASGCSDFASPRLCVRKFGFGFTWVTEKTGLRTAGVAGQEECFRSLWRSLCSAVSFMFFCAGCASVPDTKPLLIGQGVNQLDTVVLQPVEITDEMAFYTSWPEGRSHLSGSDYQRALRKALLDSGLAKQVVVRDDAEVTAESGSALLVSLKVDKSRIESLGNNWILPVGIIFFCIPTLGAGTPIMLAWPLDNLGSVSSGDLCLLDAQTRTVLVRERVQITATAASSAYDHKKVCGQMESILVWNFAGKCVEALRERFTADQALGQSVQALSSKTVSAPGLQKAAALTGVSNQRDEHKTAGPAGVSDGRGEASQWAVCVGVSTHQKGTSGGLDDLPFAAEDARLFSESLVKSGWSPDHVKCLTDGQATKNNVEVALESWLTKARRDDMIVFYWAGHGFPDPDDPEKVYFACHDTDIHVPATGYRMDRVRSALEERGARNVVVLADTCHAGKLVTRGGERGMSVVPAIRGMDQKDIVPKGWVFMVSADADRKAIENSAWRNGAFTYCLLRGLAGAADGFQSSGAKDGAVTLGELRAYLTSAMPEETQKVLGVAKHPVIATSSGDPSIWNLTILK